MRKMRITAKADQQRGRVQHGAVDISAPVDTPVYAIADSTVLKIQPVNEVYVGAGGTHPSSCGSQVALIFKHPQSPSEYSFVNYCHLKSINPRLREGMKIKGGTIIGTSGGKVGDKGAGNTTGPHLHMSIRLGDKSFRSNSLSANPSVYDTFFENSKVPPRRIYHTLTFKVLMGLIGIGGIAAIVYHLSEQ